MPTLQHETLDELFLKVETSRQGLSTSEASKRLKKFGFNELASRPLKWQLVQLVKVVAAPVNLILVLACFASGFLGQTFDSVLILAMVFLSSFLNFWQTYRSEKSVRQLQKQITMTATVLRDGNWKELARRELVIGDIIHLASGDLVPADARLIETNDLHVQEAALTGESFPVEKSVSMVNSSGPATSESELVFLGTSIVSGSATAVIFASGSQTKFGDIVERLSEQPEDTEFEKGARHFGMLILKTVFFLVLFVLTVNLALGRDAFQSLLYSVALAVGLAPEFLPMITTVTLGQGALEMAKRKVIVKHLSSIQNLGSIDILCSDKTGTLTSGNVTLDASVDPFGATSDKILKFARLNSQFQTGIRSPIDIAILGIRGPDLNDYQKIGEIPFDFNRRRLSVIVQNQSDITIVTKGAPESILKCCRFFESNNKSQPLDDIHRDQFIKLFQDLSQKGFRVLGVSIRKVFGQTKSDISAENEMTFVGFLTFSDHLLEEIPRALQALQRDGIKVKILTGDNEIVTRYICEQVGIEANNIILGSEIEISDDIALAKIAESSDVFARVSPAQKHRIIRALKSAKHVVGFIGDGINDAPSLHSADVGISVAGAVDVARDASDIILLERKLDVLHAGILAGRHSYGNVFKYLLMGTSSNFGNMLSMAAGTIFLPFLPMLPTQILLNNFLYDTAQLTIPTDNVDPVFIAKPQRWNINIIRNFMITVGPISSLYDFLTFYVFLKVFHFNERMFQTGWFVESLVTQVLVVFVIRTIGKPWSNKPSLALALTVFAVSGMGVALPFSPFAEALGFESLPAPYFLFLAILVSTYLFIVQMIKQKIMRQVFGRSMT